MGLTGMFRWGMKQTAEFVNQMTSVERVTEYSHLESEHPLESAPGTFTKFMRFLFLFKFLLIKIIFQKQVVSQRIRGLNTEN